MTRERPRLLDPSRLQPVVVDLRRVFLVGTLAWVLAAVVAVVGATQERVHWETAATCGAGAALGLLALDWERRRRRRGDAAPGTVA